MEPFYIALATVGFLFGYLILGVWVFVAITMVGLSALYLLLDFPLDRIGSILRSTMWKSAASYELASVPLFILMGELIFRTNISDKLFRGLTPWVNHIPGRLLHCNIGGCTLFAAISGSSTATTATVGKITLAELQARGYDRNLAVGSLAGAGSLGLLIPPSISMIIYGILSETSIAHLFAAGLLPGLLIAALFSAYIGARALMSDTVVREPRRHYALRQYLWSFVELLPILSLLVIVMGGIYSGIVTPSEAAALGVAAALLVSGVGGQLNRRMIVEALVSASRTSCMVLSILVAAAFMSSAIAFAHVPQETARLIAAMNLGPVSLILLIGVFYIIVGMFLDGLSIMVMTLPITLPLILSAGWDPVWFGVFLVITIELGLVTPPVGFNLFVLQGMTGLPIGRIARAAFPFFLLMVVAALIIIAVPDIALWLPRALF
ncbi:MAG: TRAP transporter large permease subunit [Rhodobacteraceae bacterium]|jgi:tripartite ATP-independent transporter DctM subunit|nr:TRAP transporter large permease subunit [Paracoccaceae bacterium]